MLLQVGGLSFPNVVAVLLLPVFIFPGLAGLKIRLYVSRRPDSYSRLDTAAYSWTISTVSVVFVYAAIASVQGDISLIPQFVLAESGTAISTSTETSGMPVDFDLVNLFLVYLAHVTLCCTLGALYGVVAFNFFDDVRFIGRATNREYMLNQVMPGRRVDVRTKAGELLRGKIPSRHRNEHDEGLLLLNPERMADDEWGHVVKQHDIGESMYISSEEISRISVIDDQNPDNVDPEQTVNNTDRVQSFVIGVCRGLYPANSLKSLRNVELGVSLYMLVPSLSLVLGTIGIYLTASSSGANGVLTIPYFGFLGGGVAIGLISFIFASATAFYTDQFFSKRVCRAIGYFGLGILFFTLTGSWGLVGQQYDIWLLYFESLSSVVAGVMIGLLWTYATNWKRAFAGHAVFAFAMSSIFTANAFFIGRPLFRLNLDVEWVWVMAVVWVLAAMVEGGPSRREPWSSKLQIPLAMITAVLLVVFILTVPWLTVNPDSPPRPLIVVPLVLSFVATVIGYLFVEQSPYLPSYLESVAQRFS